MANKQGITIETTFRFSLKIQYLTYNNKVYNKKTADLPHVPSQEQFK